MYKILKKNKDKNIITISGIPTVESIEETGISPGFVVKMFLNSKRNKIAENLAKENGIKWS